MRLVPGPAAPPGVTVLRANNNLDAVDHGGRRYLVWRTAPLHFASPKAMLNVVSSADGGRTWSREHSIALGRDVREPRFLSWDGRLFLVFTTLGRTWRRFEPDRVHISERRPDGWTRPRDILPRGYVAWRARVLGGRPVLSAYGGGGTIYTSRPEPTRVELWTTTDGLEWAPLGAPVHTGGSETEIVESPGGGYVAVTRKEGPHGGWGSDVCAIGPDLSGSWRLRPTPRKLDSPLLFPRGDEVYLLARRQLAFDGRYDLGWRSFDEARRTKLYQALYWVTRKRTSLWRIDARELEAEWVCDLPSRGDTCFPALVREDADRFTVYNYSSPLGGRDRVWVSGQLGPTWIYACELRFR